MRQIIFRCICILGILCTGISYSIAEESTPTTTNNLEELLNEARLLFAQDRPIDARVKLQAALQLAPDDYRPHLFLAEYYLAKVGHFSLAYRYALHAQTLFNKVHGTDPVQFLQSNVWKDHARLLYVVSEAQLNFDRYQESLDTLDTFGKLYWDAWYPGSKAWVLMKLQRYEEAIETAQAGLLRTAEPGRTYNILGILLSVVGRRDHSLRAFAKAIESEMADGPLGQAATPLNNAGEVYRELFRDDYAEAAWRKALSLPDGCDHVLPSLNLATLYIDELRLFAAERALSDFEACFAERSIRTDTEHRALLALSRGRIALRKGEIDTAIDLLTTAQQRQQWFGKIGTHKEDVALAVHVSLAQALLAKVAAIADQKASSFPELMHQFIESPWLKLRAWWFRRHARQLAVTELSDFEDLYVRHTDAMLEYPTLGSFMMSFSERGLRARIALMLQTDDRPQAKSYYQTYLAKNLLAHGKEQEALSLLAEAEALLRPFDRLLRAEIFLTQYRAIEQQSWSWFRNEKDTAALNVLAEKMFVTTPALIRTGDISLPVTVDNSGSIECSSVTNEVADILLRRRFSQYRGQEQSSARYSLKIGGVCSKKTKLFISLVDRSTGRTVNAIEGAADSEENIIALTNQFIATTFAHQSDPQPRSLPTLPILPASMR